ncbi:hypothetical protein RRG08_028432 [Elysia crispata]|uniref:CCHC NOA-type domain-containing protein n=1 Tax=Elysia crispata TaxID=231223 RepID=A0AAE1AUA5_9GAST|nr:hypothetical protein RRG08_028432 [Elysia crispata]
MMTSTPPPSSEGLPSQRSSPASSGRMTDSRCSITDLTLEQALIRIKEIEDENRAHRDNLRQHNAVMRGHYEDLALWRKREQEKFEQAKALITALREENQEKQVQIMTLKDKEKEISAELTSMAEERSHLMRQKAICDQRIFNLLKQAEEQGVKGLVPGDDDEAATDSDNIVFVSTSEKEAEIAKLEAAVENKDETIAQLRASLLQREHEVESLRDTTKQLLKDMQNQQQLKESIQEENRTLTQQLMEAEKQKHQYMQAEMATKRLEMQVQRQSSAEGKLSHLVTESGGTQAEGSKPIVVSYPDNSEELMTTLQSLNAERQREQAKKDLEKKVEESQRAKDTMEKEINNLRDQVKELQLEVDQQKTRANEIQLHANRDLDALTQQYEGKLREFAQQSRERDNQQSMQAATTGDVSILRSQVLSLIKEVDEANTKNSALTATCHLKDDKIRELEENKGLLITEREGLFEENSRFIQTLQSLHRQQEQTQLENKNIKSEYKKLQDSFSQLVTDYKDMEEMFETHRNEAKELSAKFQIYRQQAEEKLSKKAPPKQVMEEINRLTAQVIAADEAMRCKDEELGKLQAMEQVLRIQADQYQSDFHDERESRTKLAEELNTVKEQNRKLKEENNLINMQKFQTMQARYSGVPGTNLVNPPYPRLQYPQPMYSQTHGNPQQTMPSASGGGLPPVSGASAMLTYPGQPSRTYLPGQEAGGFRPTASQVVETGAEEDLSSLRQYQCPKCHLMFPDEDTVQLHVQECLERD